MTRIRGEVVIATLLLMALVGCGTEPEPGARPATVERGIAVDPPEQSQIGKPASFYLEGVVRARSLAERNNWPGRSTTAKQS